MGSVLMKISSLLRLYFPSFKFILPQSFNSLINSLELLASNSLIMFFNPLPYFWPSVLKLGLILYLIRSSESDIRSIDFTFNSSKIIPLLSSMNLEISSFSMAYDTLLKGCLIF